MKQTVIQSGLAAECVELSRDGSLARGGGRARSLRAILRALGFREGAGSVWTRGNQALVAAAGSTEPGSIDRLLASSRQTDPAWLVIDRGSRVDLHPLRASSAVSGRPRYLTRLSIPAGSVNEKLLEGFLGEAWEEVSAACQVRAGGLAEALVEFLLAQLEPQTSHRSWSAFRSEVDRLLVETWKALNSPATSPEAASDFLPPDYRGALEWELLSPAVIARVHELLVNPLAAGSRTSARKRSGAYFTPPWLAGRLIRETLDLLGGSGGRDLPTILDPAMGAGVFLLEAAIELGQRSAPRGRSSWGERLATREVIRKSLFGVDLDPVTVELARALLAALVEEPGRPGPEADGLACGDSLQPPPEGGEPVKDGFWASTFPRVFRRDRPGFDAVVGNPPWEELTTEADAFWSQRIPGWAGLKPVEKKRAVATLQEAKPGTVRELEALKEESRKRREALTRAGFISSAGDSDLYRAFSSLFLDLRRDGGAVGIVLPRSSLVSLGSSEWRQKLLTHSRTSVTTFTNKEGWLFPEVNPGYEIALISSAGAGSGSSTLSVLGGVNTHNDLKQGAPVLLDLEAIRTRDPNFAIPDLRSETEVHRFSVMARAPSLTGARRPDFEVRFVRELDASNDSDLFRDEGIPVLNHRHVGRGEPLLDRPPFALASEAAAIERLISKRKSSARRKSHPLHGEDPDALADPSTLAFRRPRLVFRDVVHASTPRKLWACTIPAGYLLTNKAPSIELVKGPDEVLPWLEGILSTELADWWIRTRMVLSLNFFILGTLPVPLFDRGDERCRILIKERATSAAEEAYRSLLGLQASTFSETNIRKNSLAA